MTKVIAGVVMALWLISIAGCEQTPNEKRARLIAAENLQLEKDLAGRDARIAQIRTDCEKQLKDKDEQLAACRQRNAVLESDLNKSVAERVEQVTAKVLAENAALRKEIETLRAKSEPQKNP